MKSASQTPAAGDSNTTEADHDKDEPKESAVLEGLIHELAVDLPKQLPEGLVESLQNGDNPMQILGTLFKHQDCLPGIAQTICEKVQGKFESGALNEQRFVASESSADS